MPKQKLNIDSIPVPESQQMNRSPLGPAIILAIAKSQTENAEKAARKHFPNPGEIPVHAVLEFTGKLVQGQPSEQRPNLANYEVLILALHRSGVQQDGILAVIKSIADDYAKALQKGQSVTLSEALQPFTAPLEGTRKALESMLESLPKIPKAGSMRFVGDIVDLTETPTDAPETDPSTEEKLRSARKVTGT